MVEAFQERRDWIVPALNEIEGVRCQLPRGAFYVFPNVEGLCRNLDVFAAHERLPEMERSRVTPAHMLQMFLLYRYGIATMDRASFGVIGSEGQHYLRLSIANSLDEIQKGVRRLADASADAGGFARFAEENPPWRSRSQPGAVRS